MSERHDPLADPLTPYWRQKVERATGGAAPRGDLTDFERDVLTLRNESVSNAAIAARFGVTQNIVSDAYFRARAKTRGAAA